MADGVAATGVGNLNNYSDVIPSCSERLFAASTALARSESRGALRRHFEVDAEFITLATLYRLKKEGKCDGQCVANAVKDLGIDPEKQSALYA